MDSATGVEDGPAQQVLTVSRVLDAPPDVVFRVWTEPEHVVQWWGPKNFTTPHHEMDVRPGGAYRFCLRSPDGAEHWMRGEYREVVKPERLVFTFAWEGEDGKPGHQTLVTVTFARHDGKTRLTFHQAVFQSEAERDSHHGGWTESFDRLEAYLTRM